MKDYINSKVLITTREWFFAPDGRQYKAVHGTLKGVHAAKDVFGFTVNASHANWLIEVGDMAILGCQVLYCVRCETVDIAPKETYSMHEGRVIVYTPPINHIYQTT